MKSRSFPQLLRGLFAFLFCGSLVGCLSPNGVITFNDTTFASVFNGPGALITSFGNEGTSTSPQLMLNFGSHGVAVDSNGRMLVTGFVVVNSANPGVTNFAVARFLPNGILDTSFGPANNGISTFQFQANSDEKACAVLIDPLDNNSIVVAGRSMNGNGSVIRTVVFEKLSADGTVPTHSTFASYNTANPTQLTLTTDEAVSDSGDDDSCVSMVLAPPTVSGTTSNGYVAAYSMPASGNSTTIQMNAVHILSQNSTAPVASQPVTATGTISYVYDLQLTPSCNATSLQAGDCPIVILGSDADGSGEMLIWSALVTASSVANSGLSSFKVDNQAGSQDTPRASIFDSTGNLLITGYSALGGNNSGHVLFLIRALTASNYLLDTSFGTFGYAYNPFRTFDSAAFAIAIDSQNRILIGGGFTGNNTGLDQALLRYQPTGFIDQSFGPYQGLATNAVTAQDDVVTSIYYDSSRDRIVTIGFAGANVNGTNGGNDGGNVTLSAYTSSQ